MDDLWTLLALRMATSAAVVVTASLVVERAGPFIGAMIATLPLSAGPAYAFLAQDHDSAFVATSAIGSLLSVAASTAFLLTYIATAPRAGTFVSLAASLAAWMGSLALLAHADWTIGGAFWLTLGSSLAGIALTRSARGGAPPPRVAVRPWHIAVRAASVMVLVVTVTLVGQSLGPRPAGFAALVPIVFTSLIAILQPRVGGRAMAGVMANSLLGMTGYAFALLGLNLAAGPFGATAALLLALAVCVGWNGGLVMVMRRR